jgi:hypothetical protein
MAEMKDSEKVVKMDVLKVGPMVVMMEVVMVEL